MLTVKEMCSRLGIEPDENEEMLVYMLMCEAEAYMRCYCRLRDGEEVPAFLLAKMVTEDYGRIDGAGIQARTLSGANEQYRSQYSEDVTAMLRSLRHIGTVPAKEREV